ncbi:MAG: PAS domain S-box-containing protein [Ancylomarina sp.]|jgi:PAS domain S-box-containing protein
MKNILKVLLLEDSPRDIEILKGLLIASGFELQIDCTESEKEFVKLLMNNKYDVILSDFNLPGFDGFAALRLVMEICPDTPFILISGTIGEEKAIEFIKLGATDFVLKDRMARLPKAIQDAIERKRTEEKIVVSEKRYRDLFNQANEGLLLMTPAGILSDLNQSFAKMHGYTVDELKNYDIRKLDVLGEKTLYDCADHTGRILAGEVVRFEVEHHHKDGHIFPLSVTASLVNISDQQFFMAFHQDITERKRTEKELNNALEKATESDRLKSAFLANMSHEIRTPMNGILGFAELLKKPDLTGDEQKNYIIIIEKAGERMLNIINDIISISKIESGELEINLSDTNIHDQLDYVYNLLKLEAKSTGLSFSFINKLPDKEAIIKTDREKVFAILTNLVKNAIKYTEKGSIEFGCEMVGLKHALSLQFYVKDTGIGIPKDRQIAIFERFVQADLVDKMARQGAGLGLSISNSYIKMLGGKIWVESEEGLGSTFYFTLPFNTQTEEKNNAHLALDKSVYKYDPEVSELKILIAEDDETAEKLLSINVEEICNEILKARTGREAIDICYNKPDIDLILMDIQMPDINGYKATQQIRQFNKDVIIIAQTAFGLSDDKKKAIEAGCNDYISKPINRLELLVLIQKYFKN